MDIKRFDLGCGVYANCRATNQRVEIWLNSDSAPSQILLNGLYEKSSFSGLCKRFGVRTILGIDAKGIELDMINRDEILAELKMLVSQCFPPSTI